MASAGDTARAQRERVDSDGMRRSARTKQNADKEGEDHALHERERRIMRVMNTQCQTCIYRSDSPLDLKELEAEVTDPHMAGFFSGYRTCHHSHAGSDACCRGFWDRHKWKFTGGPDCSAAWFCGVQRKKRAKAG